jgi:alternate signal-mediated exported protein
MNKTTKGALAGGVGVLLLLGGAGTMAFWSDSKPIPGGAINAGHLRIITDGTNKGCGAWKLDSAEDAPVTYTVGQPLVPGDVLTRDCAFTVQAVGDHLRATVGISAVNFTGGDFAGKLDASVSDVAIDGTPVTSFTEADDGGQLTAGVTITFDSSALNGTEDLSTLLDSLTLTATQVHA